MKKIIYITSLLSLSVFTLSSCESDTTELNNDPKHPTVVPSENLVVSSERYLADRWVSPSVNGHIARFYTQQWSETQYVDETNYNFVTRNQPNGHYTGMMRDVIGPLATASGFLDKEDEDANLTPEQQSKVKLNKKATIELISVFTWLNLVDTFGDVPYTEALKTVLGSQILQPKYDDAATIYADLQKRIDAAVNSMTFDLPGYKKDAFYKGDMAKWKKFANTLKFMMGLNLSDVDNAKAKQLVETAYNSGIILSDSDEFTFPYVAAQFNNPVYQNLVASGRDDFLPSDVYVNALKAKNDPRVPKYFTKDPNGNYTGSPYGELATFSKYSHITSTIQTNTYPGYIFDTVFIKIMLAEAAAKGYSVGGTAQSYYNDFILTSMKKWGVADADAATYLASVPFNSANWKKSIGDEAWVSMYNRGIEAWYFFRRLDYPTLQKPPVAQGLVYRMPYPNGEYDTNRQNVTAAAAKISGGDKYTSKVFWDKN
ncbi:SusD/RagB family nutrient-binding outer membrane lipoprotein [Elizabethkingia anophelis]|uniref:SusD/RagB family nutrient-binding outer membrane lipoprotein n=1 Tax=Elizabethkingia anophelis TaxID=1117645 RepID=A0AAE4NZY8_9FLAO|nr:SusD/RagB family nutrient-binding outer membrane lipoprotein [Elizabethkingia anophelis]AQW93420.1 hypothetical protein BBD30_04040 [Elizabethkingia anophelis]AQX01839.1 hypothetical protein BBD32_10375 [Elizabethkingia anophelis]KFC33487.1 hypothetical protein FF18_08790 [Elizabethkingia anophelis]MCL1035268.1 SusD/RagB family nutrient-binding outer membrane lipoprotein [Elizabethkingia anophelis]MCL1689869.1 SusD/RagB family nutrient-binding outer membrane lipoprotein [Elizabethkingia ano